MTEKKITKKEIFDTLSKIDVSEFVEVIRSKNPKTPPLKYLSWPHAVGLLMKHYSDIEGPIWEKYPEMILLQNGQYQLTGRNVPYLTTPKGTMVTCTVTVEGNTYSESLYVMDYRNKVTINPDMGEINKTQKRCLAKCIAEMGLGLNIYAGEDLPVGDLYEQNDARQKQSKQNKDSTGRQSNASQGAPTPQISQSLKDEYNDMINRLNQIYPEAERVAIEISVKRIAFNDKEYQMKSNGDYKKAIETAREQLGEEGYVEETTLDGQG
ncbi:DUF1071 domain-containing protein [Ligilactobacillus saerimneri]|uniref:Sak single strand annealing protein n=1 Tax=Ligilactobacillus saerimneri TaxID=228229 RepID=UPI0024BAB4E5|nr:DUF1071 domain-containing protein [Ligilactobacillus saerimneri]